MKHNATQADIDAVTGIVKEMGFRAEPIPGSERTAIGVLDNQEYVDDCKVLEQPGVERVIHVSKPYKLVSRDFHPEDTIVDVAGVKVGSASITLRSFERVSAATSVIGAGSGSVAESGSGGGTAEPRSSIGRPAQACNGIARLHDMARATRRRLDVRDRRSGMKS